MICRVFLLVILTFLSFTVHANHVDGKTLSLHELYTNMLSPELDPIDGTSIGHSPAYYALNGFFAFRKVKFEFVRKTDEYWDKRYLQGGEKLTVNKGIAFEQCAFPDVFWFLFRDMEFKETVSFVETSNMRFKFKNCVFKGPVQMRVSSDAQFMEFENCVFERGFEVMEGARFEEFLIFKNCTFKYNEAFIVNPRVHKDQFNIGELLECPRYFSFPGNTTEIDLQFITCRFEPIHTQNPRFAMYIDLSHSAFKSLEFTNCQLGVPLDLSFVSVANQFKFFNTKLLKVAAEAMSFNSSNSKMDWQNFKGHKLNVKNEKQEFIGGTQVLHSKYEFETLISIYAQLYSSYKEQGNRLSANSVYVEWKDIETQYLKSAWKTSFDSTTWFTWFMNAFLKFFCDYGTNPFKSIIWSFYVMLAFTVFFFMALWNHDTSEHNDIRYLLRNFGQYFTHRKSFNEIAVALSRYKEENNGEELRQYIAEYKTTLPFYFSLLARRVSIRRIYFPSRFLFNWADRRLGLWEDASKQKRTWISVLLFGWMLFLLIKIFLIRIFDAFTMSLNSFSTLGYGELPQNELVRYMTIIEGFIGWFLLSIFSVALISQIIQ